MPEATAIGIFHRDEERTIAKTDWRILILGSIRETSHENQYTHAGPAPQDGCLVPTANIIRLMIDDEFGWQR
jgi:hypothetical protein